MRTLKSTLIAAITAGLLAGTSVGVVGQSGDEGPVQFTGRIAGGSPIASGTVGTVDDRTETRGNGWTFSSVEVSDPRLEGTVTHTLNIDDHDGQVYRVLSATWRIENEGGAWEGSEHSVILPDGSRTTATAVLSGEGGYAGLTALVEVTFVGFDKEWRGVILEGGLPPLPEPASPE
jgi:hypothetical protein